MIMCTIDCTFYFLPKKKDCTFYWDGESEDKRRRRWAQSGEIGLIVFPSHGLGRIHYF